MPRRRSSAKHKLLVDQRPNPRTTVRRLSRQGLAAHAAAREAAEKEARLQEILEQIRRDDAQARYDRYTGRSRDDDDDDYDRGRERERER